MDNRVRFGGLIVGLNVKAIRYEIEGRNHAVLERRSAEKSTVKLALI